MADSGSHGYSFPPSPSLPAKFTLPWPRIPETQTQHIQESHALHPTQPCLLPSNPCLSHKLPSLQCMSVKQRSYYWQFAVTWQSWVVATTSPPGQFWICHSHYSTPLTYQVFIQPVSHPSIYPSTHCQLSATVSVHCSLLCSNQIFVLC